MPKILHSKGKYIPLLLFFLISLSITLIWFKQGLMYGGAEVGLLTYNPQRSLEIQKYLWWEAVAPGWPIPHFLSGIPLYFILSVLRSLSFSPAALQALLFCILLFMMGYGIYLFALTILGKDKRIYAIIAGLFYMFNPFTMVDVWHRFLYTQFFLAAFLPFLALFWKNWISKGIFLHLFLFLLTNFLAVYMYGNIASLITVWLLLTILTIPRIVLPWEGILNFVQVGKRFLLGFVIWTLVNTWWLIPILATDTGLLSEGHSAEVNLTTLVNISRKTILPYSLQFTNPFYLFFTAELGEAYRNFPITMIPWIGTIIIFIGVFVALRQGITSQYGVSYLISILIAKGVAIPFSAPLLFGFTHLYVLGVLRNPYEKLGILLPFFGSILFVLGLEKLKVWGARILGLATIKSILLAILLIFFAYSLPMFTGEIFGNKQYPLLVEVPEYYREADEWLALYKGEEGNILHLPFSGRDVVTYDWNVGYHGVEINELLFTQHPSISRKVGLKNTDRFLEGLTLFFTPPYSSDKNQILRLLQNLSIRFIILHKDTNPLDISTYGINIRQNNPYEIEKVLDELPFVKKVASFGKLDIYKLQDASFKDKIFISDNVQLVFPSEAILKNLNHTRDNGEVVTPINESIPSAKFSQILIFPQNSASYRQSSASALINMIHNNLNLKGEDSSFNRLEFIRDYFDSTGELESRRKVEQVILATQNLFNIYQQKLKNTDADILSLLMKYENSIDAAFKNDFKTLRIVKLFRSILSDIFQMHLFILNEQIYNQKEQQLVSQALKTLKLKLIDNDFLPQYQFINEEDKAMNKQVFKFNVLPPMEYELIMDNAVETDLRINGEQKNFDRIYFPKGNFEISVNELLTSSLAPPFEQWQRQESIYSSPFFEVMGGGKLKIAFEGLLEGVNIIKLVLLTDTEYQTKENESLSLEQECSFHTCFQVQFNAEVAGWQSFNVETEDLNASTQKVSLKIILPAGDSILGINPKLSIRDIRVQKILDNNIFLRKRYEYVDDSSFGGKVIESKRQSPVSYTGKLNLERPSFIFFGQTFHPGWSLKLKNNNGNFYIEKHYMGNYFANAWYIERLGEYDFEIKFEPQKNVNLGYVISLLTGSAIFIALIFTKFRKKYV